MFPHLVNLTARPFGSVSVDEVESHFHSKLSAAVVGHHYDAFMDMSLVVYAKNLSRYWSHFVDTQVGFLPLVWPDADSGKDWFSLIVNIPHTQVVVEIVSDTWSVSSSGGSTAFVRDTSRRLNAARLCEANNCTSRTAQHPRIFVPLAVSKAVSSLSNTLDFYTTVLRATTTTYANNGNRNRSSSDPDPDPDPVPVPVPVQMAMVSFVGAAMQVRLVQRPLRNTTGEFSIMDLERVKFEGHDMALGRTPEETALCGFSKWYVCRYVGM
jgi:hypothetical protein